MPSAGGPQDQQLPSTKQYINLHEGFFIFAKAETYNNMAIEYDKKKKYASEELMEMAYQESMLSIHEHDDKPDPLVGAILTTADGKILATAHRGECVLVSIANTP